MLEINRERTEKKLRKKLFYAHTSNFVLLFTASSESPSSPVANGVSILPLPREVGGASDVVAPPKTNQNKNNNNKTIPKTYNRPDPTSHSLQGIFPSFWHL